MTDASGPTLGHPVRPLVAKRALSDPRVEPNPLLAAALSYAARDWAVFPLRQGAKQPDGRLAPHGLRDATCDERRIRAWWATSPAANIGLRTGEAIDVVDVDGPRSLLGDAGWAALRSDVLVSTGRGWHLYFAAGGLATKAAVIPGVDTRGVGGYVVAPPSLHPDGHRYRFVDPATGELRGGLGNRPVPPVPRWLIDACRPQRPEVRNTRQPVRLDAAAYVRAALAGECAAVVATPAGSRNHRLNRAAFAAGTLVGAAAIDEVQVTQRLLSAALAAGLPEAEARRTIASGLRAGVERPRQLGGDGRGPPPPEVIRASNRLSALGLEPHPSRKGPRR